MGRSALSKLSEASDLNKEANKIRKRDPESARSLDDLARNKRKSAIKQMKHRPGRPKSTAGKLPGMK